jgi:hypothetical protein
MSDPEKYQLLGDEGYIHTPKSQKIGSKKIKAEVIEETDNLDFDDQIRLILRGPGRHHNAATVHALVASLAKRGKLKDFLKALQDEIDVSGLKPSQWSMEAPSARGAFC